MPPFITKLLSNLSQNLNVKPSNSKSPFDNINMSTIDLNNSRLTMSFTGQIQLWSKDKVKGWSLIWWKPRDKCSLINHCGNFGSCNSSNKLECTCLPGLMPVSPENWDSGDYTGGCQRKSKFCPGKDTFLSLKKVKVESEYSKVPATNETDCLEQCRNTCQCQAYSYDEPKNSTRRGDPTSTTTCLLWTEDLSGIQEEYGNDGPDLHVRVAASDTENGNTTQDGGGYPKRGRKKWTLIVGVTVASVILLSSTTVYFYLRRKNVERQENRESIRQNMAARFYDSARHVKDLAWRLWQEDKALDIMDQKLSPSFNKIEILKCINVGLLCVQEDPNDRPTMSNVVIMLGSETATLATPKRPAFVMRRGPSTSASSSSKLDINSELTVSLTGR
ncbi:hypothetical protein Patl1_02122 [Pistacia atlantica]|uniref:Uncharacterized protein n=1 Tax=Pistacia atlantica TaxID=434234 RepID=A0ACC1CA66_9ROSI|nr:hypothetical protein Patl1_02122 [Pistacia atlantica]